MSRVFVTDTVLRDAHQSLLATRMRTADMLPICPKLDKVGALPRGIANLLQQQAAIQDLVVEAAITGGSQIVRTWSAFTGLNC